MTTSELRTFCILILDALENPENSPPWFRKDRGLCSNAIFYDHAHSLDHGHETEVLEQLEFLFDGKSFPFNNEVFAEYNNELYFNTIYENKKRLAFLKKYAGVE